jgi:hypothetical protein
VSANSTVTATFTLIPVTPPSQFTSVLMSMLEALRWPF